MDELSKAFRRFIMRDMVFILGGGSVILSFLYYFDFVEKILELRWGFYVFIAGIAYVVGYAVQDGMSLLGIVTTRDYFKPNCFVKWMYERFCGAEWRDIKPFDSVNVRIIIDEKASEGHIKRLERTTSLRQIGTTMGPCGIISAMILFSRAWKAGCGFDTTFAMVISVFSLVLICLGRLKTAQYTELKYKLHTEIEAKKIRKEGGETQ
jgi:hypothetical protein